jgi:hypothetical protein
VSALPKDLTEVCIFERLDRGELELEYVSLAGIHVWCLAMFLILVENVSKPRIHTNGMYALTLCGERIVQYIVACRGNGEDMVRLVDA